MSAHAKHNALYYGLLVPANLLAAWLTGSWWIGFLVGVVAIVPAWLAAQWVYGEARRAEREVTA